MKFNLQIPANESLAATCALISDSEYLNRYHCCKILESLYFEDVYKANDILSVSVELT